MASINSPENVPVFFVGVKGDVKVTDKDGKEIKLKKGDKIPAEASISLGAGDGKIVFKQAGQTLKYADQGEVSLTNALINSVDASQDADIETLVETAEQITTTQEPATQPLAQPTTTAPTPAKQGISESPAVVHAERGEEPQPTATEIVAQMADLTVTRSAILAAPAEELRTQVPQTEGTVVAIEERTPPPPAPVEPVVPAPYAPSITSFAPNTGATDDNITSAQQLTVTGTAPAGTSVALLCDGSIIRQGINVSEQGQWSTRVNTGRDGSFTFTATAINAGGTSQPSAACPIIVDSSAPELTFDNPAGDVGYDFVTYSKNATITGTATPGLTFTLVEGDKASEVTASDKGLWSQNLSGLNDGMVELSASAQSVAGVEVSKCAKLFVQSAPYDVKVQPDTGADTQDRITNSEQLLLKAKAQPGAKILLTIAGSEEHILDVDEEGNAEFALVLAGDQVYKLQLKTLYTDNAGESDTVETDVTLDTAAATLELDKLESVYSEPDVNISGHCSENGTTVTIKLVNVLKPEISSTVTAEVKDQAFEAQVSAPEPGNYRIEITTTDVAGNTGEAEDYSFKYELPHPELVIETRPEDSSLEKMPVWTGTFPHGGKLEATIGDTTETISVSDDNTWTYTPASAPLTLGDYSVVFTGSQAGLPGTATEEDFFSIVDQKMELVVDETPGDRTNIAELLWKGSGAAPNAKVTLTLTSEQEGTEPLTKTVDADTQGSFTIILKVPEEGRYTAELSATAEGFQPASHSADPLTVDRTGPELTIDDSFRPVPGDNILKGVSTDKVGEVTVKLDGGESFTGTIADNKFSVKLFGLTAEQAYKATITGTDDLGNQGEELPYDFTVHALLTMALVIDEGPGERTSAAESQWKGSGAAPDAKITLTLTSDKDGAEPLTRAVNADADGKFTVALPVPEDGQYTTKLSATAEGFKPATHTADPVTVDRTGPVLKVDDDFKAIAGNNLLTGTSTDKSGNVVVKLDNSKSFTGSITDGTFSVELIGLTAEQAYKATIIGTDDLGNKGEELPYNFTVACLPTMTLVIDENPGERTSAAEPQWKGSGAAPDAKVTLTLTSDKDGAEPLTRTVNADTEGKFTVALPVPKDGQYTTKLSATAEGFKPASHVVDPVTVDRTGPQLKVDGDFKAGPGDNVLTGASTDKAGDVVVKLDDGQSFAGTIANGKFSVKLSGLTPEQAYKATITGTDDLGNKGEALSFDFTVNSLPTMALSVDEGPDARTSAAEPQWKGSGAAPNAKVTLTLTSDKDGAKPLTKTVDADAEGMFTVVLPVPEDGQYTTKLSATAEGYQPVSHTEDPVTIDRTGPELKADADFKPTAGDCILSGTSTDKVGTVVATLGDKTFDGTITDGRYSVKVTGLEPEQAYQISVVGTDDLGNKGEPLPYDFSTPALPTMTLAVEEGPGERTSAAEPQWKGSGAAANAKVTLTLTSGKDGTRPLTKTVNADAEGKFTVALPVPDEGQYTTKLSATAEGFQPASHTADSVTVDRTGPELKADADFKPAAGDCVLSGTSTDKTGTVVATLGDKTFDGTITDGRYTVTVTGLESEQAYQISVVGTDDLGNKGEPLPYDFSTPALPTMTLVVEEGPGERTNAAEPQWKGSGTAANAKVTLTLTSDKDSNKPLTKTVDADAEGKFTVGLAVPEDGQYTTALSATADGFKSASHAAGSVTVDRTGPELKADVNFKPTAGDCVLSGTSTDKAGTILATLGDKTFDGTITDGRYSVKVTGLEPEQAYQISVVGTDDLGNKGKPLPYDFSTPVLPTMTLAVDEAPGERTNAAEPQWKGSGAAPDAKITLTLTSDKDGAEPLTRAVNADADGKFTVALPVPEDGQYTTKLSATAEGFKPATHTADPVTVDRTGPVLKVDDDFKAIAGNNLLTGTSTDKSGNVVVKLDNSKSFTGSITDGTFSVELIGLTAEQAYKATIIGTDDLGNKGEELPYDFTVACLPTMTLVIDENPGERTSAAEPQWKGSGAAPDAKVTLTLTSDKDGAEPLTRTVNADTEGKFTVALPVPKDGQYTTKLSATAEGFKPASHVVDPVTVDRTGPQLKVDGDFKAGPGDNVLTGASTDKAGDVVVKLDDGQSFAGTIANGKFSVKLSGLTPEQAYKATITGTDDLGNKGEALSFDFTVNSLPTMALSVDEGPDARTSAAEPQWKGSGAAPNAKVTLTLTSDKDGAKPLTKTVDADAEGMFTVVLPVPEDGQYTTKLSATAESYQPASHAADPVTVDRTGPELKADADFKPTAGDCILSGTSTDKVGTVVATLGDKTFDGTITDGRYSVKVTGLEPEQAYQISVAGTDDLGNKGEPLPYDFTVLPTPALFTMTLAIDEGPGERTNAAEPQWKGSGAAPDAKVTLTLTSDKDGTEPLTRTVDADAEGKFIVVLSVPDEGQYTTKLSATADGFQPASHTADPVTVDRTGPQLELSEGLETDAKAFTLSGTSTDNSGSVEVDLGSGTTFSGTISEGRWSADLSDMKEQDYTATITARDDLGNPSSQPLLFNFRVEYAKPALEITKQPVDGASDTTPTWEGTFPYEGGDLKVKVGLGEGATVDAIPINSDNTWTYTPRSELHYGKYDVEFIGTQAGKDGVASFTQSFWIKSNGDQEPPKTYELSVTEGLDSTSRTVKIKGTHPHKDGNVQLKFTGDHIETIAFKGNGPVTKVKDHQWSFTLNNLLLNQKMTVKVTAVDDDKKPLDNVTPIEVTLNAAGEAGNSHIASLSETSNAGSYGHSIVMRAPDCSGQCKPNDPELKLWSTELQVLTQPLNKVRILLNKDTYDETGVLTGQTKSLYLKASPAEGSDKVILEQPDTAERGYLKFDFSKENFKPATIYLKSQGVEHIEPFYIGVETPNLHYTFENLQAGSEYHSLTYPDHAAVTETVAQVPGSFGAGVQLGEGVLQPKYFKDLFSDSYTVCFDIKTSVRAATVDGPYPALAGYIDHDGVATHLLGAFNDKGQIGIVAGNSYAVFADPVVADGHWHHVCIVRNKLDGMSDYSIQLDGRQAKFSSDGFSVTEARHHHDLDSISEVSAYPVSVLGGVQSSDGSAIQYLDATLDSFKGYAYALTPVETSAEASAYAHVHWSCQGEDYCYHNGEYPVGHMMNEMVGTKLTPACSLHFTIEPETADTIFMVNYQGHSIDPENGTYTLDNLSPESLKTLTLKPADPDAAGNFMLNFDRTESDLTDNNDAGQVTPDGTITFDSSIFPLGSGISFGVGKYQNSSPAAGDPDLILEDIHLVTEEGTVIDGYDGSRAVINLDGLEALKGLTEGADKDNKLLSLLSSTPADDDSGARVQLQHPACETSSKTCEHDPLVVVNTVDSNTMVALSLDGNLAYYQHT